MIRDWNRNLVYYEIPINTIVNESISYIDNYDYNGAYFIGDRNGVIAEALVKDTNGKNLMNHINSPYFTVVEPVRMRGNYEFSLSGKTKNINLTLPYYKEIGVFQLGSIV